MILVTLEGLPRSCTLVLKTLSSFASVPCPIPPAATNAHHNIAEEIVNVFANAVDRMRNLQRHNNGTRLLVGAHWIDTPPGLDEKGRDVLHSIVDELTKELAVALDVCIDKHIYLLLEMNTHEYFSMLLDSMESRDVLLDDLIDSQEFLKKTIKEKPDHLCFRLPPSMHDNTIDLAIVSSTISRCIKSIT